MCLLGKSRAVVKNTIVKSKTSQKPGLAEIESNEGLKGVKAKSRSNRNESKISVKIKTENFSQAVSSKNWLHSRIEPMVKLCCGKEGITSCQTLWMRKEKTTWALFFINSGSSPRLYLAKPMPKTETSPNTNANKSKICSGQYRNLNLSLEKFTMLPHI